MRSKIIFAAKLLTTMCPLLLLAAIVLYQCGSRSGKDKVCDDLCTDSAWDAGRWSAETSTCECKMNPVRGSLRSKMAPP